ncbi:unnamed protein product, partial [Tetraodon nigroviridis]
MDAWVRFNAQSQAKERVFRAAQYACALIGYTLQRGGAGAHLHGSVKQLEAHISLTRKREWRAPAWPQRRARAPHACLCLSAAPGELAGGAGGGPEGVHLSDGVLRLCLTLTHLNRALFLACDHLLWAGRTGLLPSLDHSKWSHRSFSPARGLGVLPRPEALRLLVEVLYSNPPLLLDLLKNSCDIFIPLDRLGICRAGPGLVGACGLTSSVLSILAIIHPWLKLKP